MSENNNNSLAGAILSEAFNILSAPVRLPCKWAKLSSAEWEKGHPLNAALFGALSVTYGVVSAAPIVLQIAGAGIPLANLFACYASLVVSANIFDSIGRNNKPATPNTPS